MYLPKIFAEDHLDVLQKFIRDFPLATVITAGPNGIMANLIPMSLHSIGENGTLRCHLARANCQFDRIKDGDEVLIIFNGPQSYVTPNFYETKKVHGKVVPTWNYTTVQVRGKATAIDDPEWIYAQINDLTNAMEASNEKPWKVGDAPGEYIKKQLKAVVGVEISIDKIEGKFKVSQNQPDENRLSAQKGFSRAENDTMASLIANGGLK